MLTDVADKVGHKFVREVLKCTYVKEGVVAREILGVACLVADRRSLVITEL